MEKQNIQTELKEIKELLTNQTERPFSLDETAAYLNISPSYLYKLTSSQKIPFFKPNGKKIYFKKSDLDAWLFRNRHDTQEELEKEAEKRLCEIKSNK